MNSGFCFARLTAVRVTASVLSRLVSAAKFHSRSRWLTLKWFYRSRRRFSLVMQDGQEHKTAKLSDDLRSYGIGRSIHARNHPRRECCRWQGSQPWPRTARSFRRAIAHMAPSLSKYSIMYTRIAYTLCTHCSVDVWKWEGTPRAPRARGAAAGRTT